MEILINHWYEIYFTTYSHAYQIHKKIIKTGRGASDEWDHKRFIIYKTSDSQLTGNYPVF